MKKTKKVALVLIMFLLIVVGFNIYGTFIKDDSAQDSHESQADMYEEALEKQFQAYNEYLSKVGKEAERAKQLNDRAAEHQIRYEKLLTRWEEQADKMDSILLKREN